MTEPLPVPEEHDQLVRDLEDLQAGMYVMRHDAAADEPMLYLSPSIEDVFGFDRGAFMSSRDARARWVHPDDRERWLVNGTAAERTGEWDEEYRVLDAEGRTRVIRDRAHLIPAAGDRPAMWLGWALDVTATRDARRAILDSEARYRALVEHIPAVAFTVSNEPRYQLLYESPQVEAMLGYPVAEWLEDDELWLRAIHPDDRERVIGAWESSVATATPFMEEYRMFHADGHVVWIRESTQPVMDDAGQVKCWQGVAQDVTDRRQLDEHLDRSEARYRDLVERLPVLVYIDSDEDNPRSLYISPNVEEILGFTVATFLEGPRPWPGSIHDDDIQRVIEAWHRALTTREPFREEYRWRRPDGGSVWIRDHAKLVLDEGGTALFWQGVMEDVSERRLAEEALRASQERYRQLVEQLPVVVYHYSDSRTTDYLSPNIIEMFGYPASAYHADHTLWHRTIHPDDAQLMRQAWVQAENEGTGYEVESRYVKADGAIAWVRDTASRIRNPGGELAWQGVLVDITAQKVAEQDRVASDRRYRALVEQVPAIVYEMGPDDERRTLFVSPHVEDLLGYARQEWLDQPDIWVELLHPEDRERELAAHDEHNETGEPWSREYRLIASDGTQVWVRDQAKLVRDPDSGLATWFGIMTDISARHELEERLQLVNEELEYRVAERTSELAEAVELMGLEIGERRRAERQLRETRERYRGMVENLPAVIYSWTVRWQGDDRYAAVSDELYTSPQIESMLGYTPAEWVVDFWRERLHPHDREAVLAHVERAIRTGEPFDAEYRYLAKDGSVVWVLDQATLLSRDHAGRPEGFQGAMLDITERKLAEQQAAESEARYRMLAEQGPVIFYIFRLDHEASPPSIRLEYLSPQIADLLGYETWWWIEEPTRWFEIVHPDDRERLREENARMWQAVGPWSFDYRVIASDGRIVWVNGQGRVVSRDDHHRPERFQGFLMDITHTKEAERQALAATARQEAILEGLPGVPWASVDDPDTGRERYTYVGPQSVELFGYTPEELLGEPNHFDRLVHPGDRARLEVADQRARVTGTWDERYRALHRDGSVRAIRSIGRRVSPEGVSPQLWQGIAISDPTSEGKTPISVEGADRADVSPSG